MSKKIIAILTIITILFVCVFAACEKKDSLYIDEKEYDFVTDENGERVLSDDGRFLVYSKDENGKDLTNASGERVTEEQPFEMIEENGVFEDYGYKVTLPEGWKTTDSVGKFENTEKKQNVEMTPVNEGFKAYISKAYFLYEEAEKQKIDCSWKDDVELGEGFNNVSRFTLSSEGQIAIIYIFENSGNTYKIIFTAPDSDSAIEDSKAFCRAIEFKPYQYFDDITSATKK